MSGGGSGGVGVISLRRGLVPVGGGSGEGSIPCWLLVW